MKISTKQKQKIARQAYKEICESLNIPSNMILESIDSEIVKNYESERDEIIKELISFVTDDVREPGNLEYDFVSDDVLMLLRIVLRKKSLIPIVGEIIRSITKVLRNYDGMKRADVLNAMLNAASRQKF